jgi:hypothetical protein
MQVTYRTSSGVDPLGTILLTLTDTYATNPQQALQRAWDGARKYNRRKARDARPCCTLQCEDLLLDVASGTLRALHGPAPAPLAAQPKLPLVDKTQPSLF